MKKIIAITLAICCLLLICSCGKPAEKINKIDDLFSCLDKSYKKFPFHGIKDEKLEVVEEINEDYFRITYRINEDADEYKIAGMPEAPRKIEISGAKGQVEYIEIYLGTKESWDYFDKWMTDKEKQELIEADGSESYTYKPKDKEYKIYFGTDNKFVITN